MEDFARDTHRELISLGKFIVPLIQSILLALIVKKKFLMDQKAQSQL
jgi:hypothetical protein